MVTRLTTMRPPDVIYHSSTLADVAQVRDRTWQQENAVGLRMAADARWHDAAEAFERAASTVDDTDARTSSERAMARAVVLANLSQACFHAGRLDDAVRLAEQSCEARVASAGEASLTVARARADLAVVLSAAGRDAEACDAAASAVRIADAVLDTDDLQLSPLLDTMARVSLAAGRLAAAEPPLLRLHALLADHQQPTSDVEWMLDLVAQSRLADDLHFPVAGATHVVALEDVPDEAADAGIAGAAEAGDPIDLIDVVDTTALDAPVAVPHEPTFDASDTLPVEIALIDDHIDPPVVVPIAPFDPFADTELELVDPDVAMVARQSATESDARSSGLGFAVEYGIPSEDSPPAPVVPPVVPPVVHSVASPVANSVVNPATAHLRSSREVPLVMPSPPRGVEVIPGGDAAAKSATPPRLQVQMPFAEEELARPAKRPAISRAARAAPGMPSWVILGLAGAVALAAAWYFLGR